MIGGSYKFTEAKVRRLLGQSTRAEKARERHSNARGTETESLCGPGWPEIHGNPSA